MKMYSVKVLFLFTILLISQANIPCDADEKPATVKSERSDFKKSFTRDCASSYTVTCLKLDIVSWVDELNEDDNYDVLPGVTVVRENSSDGDNTADIVAELARDFPNDPDSRLDAFLMKKLANYLDSHSLRLSLWNEESTVGTARGGGGGGSGGGGGGGGNKGGGGGGMGMLLVAAAMMKGMLVALAVGGIAALAGKALMTGLISLLLSTIIGLKALAHHGHKQTTYEIVSKPVFTHSSSHSEEHLGHGYGHSSYGRSFDSSLPLGLKPEYKPE